MSTCARAQFSSILSALVFSIHILPLLVSVVAFDDVTSIDITTIDGTGNTVQITAWFNYAIYQQSLSASVAHHTYSLNTLTNLGPSHCHKSPSSTHEAKIMIDNTGTNDAIVIGRIALYTASGTWYGISGRCIDDALLETQEWLADLPENSQWTGYTTDELSCASGRTNIWITIDDEKWDAQPPKQIFYFDTTRPNEFIPNATWTDGTNITPDIRSCDPTSQPTKFASASTNSPTTIPSVAPSELPSYFPSTSTNSPTIIPSVTPWTYPSRHPSSVPLHRSAAPSPSPFYDISTTFSTHSQTETMIMNNKQPTLSSESVAVIAASLSFLVCAICGAVCYKKRRKVDDIQNNMEAVVVNAAANVFENVDHCNDSFDSEELYEVQQNEPKMTSEGVADQTAGAIDAKAVMSGSAQRTKGEDTQQRMHDAADKDPRLSDADDSDDLWEKQVENTPQTRM